MTTDYSVTSDSHLSLKAQLQRKDNNLKHTSNKAGCSVWQRDRKEHLFIA